MRLSLGKLRDACVSVSLALASVTPVRRWAPVSSAPAVAVAERAFPLDLPLGYSLYLDLVRFLAAGAVFLEHVSSYPFSRDTRASAHPLLTWLGSYGNTAVIVFFVLSGHVIAYVVATRERTALVYTVSRLSRLYSVVLPALVITLVFDLVGERLSPSFYGIHVVLWKPQSWWGYLSSALFINEFQLFQASGTMPGTNAPFWSLSFEATYYVIGGLLLFAPLRYAIPCALMLLGLAGRTITALLPLWVLGFWAYHARKRVAERLPAPATALALGSLAITVLPLIEPLASSTNFGLYFPWGRGPFNRNLLLDYAIALAFVLQMFAAYRLLRDAAAIAAPIKRAVRWLGSITFPMYAMHYPVLCLFAALTPFGRSSWANVLFMTCGVIGVVTMMTPVCARSRDALRNAAGSLEVLSQARAYRLSRMP